MQTYRKNQKRFEKDWMKSFLSVSCHLSTFLFNKVPFSSSDFLPGHSFTFLSMAAAGDRIIVQTRKRYQTVCLKETHRMIYLQCDLLWYSRTIVLFLAHFKWCLFKKHPFNSRKNIFKKMSLQIREIMRVKWLLL